MELMWRKLAAPGLGPGEPSWEASGDEAPSPAGCSDDCGDHSGQRVRHNGQRRPTRRAHRGGGGQLGHNAAAAIDHRNNNHYDDYDNHTFLRGTVVDVDGDEFSGQLVYDIDESESWEALNGRDRDVEFAIPFSMIASIAPYGRDSAVITLRNGEELELEVDPDLFAVRTRLRCTPRTRWSWSGGGAAPASG